MNRFEKPTIGSKLHKISLPLLGSIILFLIFIKGISSVSSTTLDKQKESLNTALNRSITQCYAVEGTYPPSLNYIENHYGLTYDHDLFFVDYQVYGSNMYPEVTIITKDKK